MSKYIFQDRSNVKGKAQTVATVEGQPGKPVTWAGQPRLVEKLKKEMRERKLDPNKIEDFEEALVIFSGSYFWLAKVE